MSPLPPLTELTPWQVDALQWSIGISSLLSFLCTTVLALYILVRLVVYACTQKATKELEPTPSSPVETELRKAVAQSTVTLHRNERELFVVLWFRCGIGKRGMWQRQLRELTPLLPSELLVLTLVVADLGSALFYLLQVRLFNVPCGPGFAYAGLVFEHAAVWVLTYMTGSLLVIMQRSRSIQSYSRMRTTLRWLLACGVVGSWIVPVLVGLAVLYFDSGVGSDQVYCFLSPNGDARARLVTYTPILALLFLNLAVLFWLHHINAVLRLRLSRLCLNWVPLSLLAVWTVPAITVFWSAVNGQSPFALVFASSMVLPAQGFIHSVLFVILLGRARKRVENVVSTLGSNDDFFICEVNVAVFGENVTWYSALADGD